LFILLALLVIMLGFVIATETGLRIALNTAEKFLPGTLRYERIEGRLISPLHIENLSYQDGDLEFALQQATLRWNPAKLLLGRLQIDLLQADGIALHLPPPTEEPAPPAQPVNLDDISLPLQITIQQSRISDVRIWPNDAEQPIVINEVVLQAATQEQTLGVDKFALSTPQGQLNAKGKLTLADAIPLTLNLEGATQSSDYPPVTFQGSAQGALKDTLQVNFDTTGAVTTTLDGELATLLTNPDWAAKLQLRIADMGAFSPELTGNPLTARLQTQGNLNDFQAHGGFATRLPEIGPLDGRLQIIGSQQSIQLEEFVIGAAEHPLAITLQADMDVAKKNLAANGQWQALAWPLTGEPAIESPQGQFALQGSLQDYTLQASTALAGPELGQLNVQLEAEGTDEAIQVSQLAVKAPDGDLSLTAHGRLSFPDLAFQADGQWQSLAWPVVGTPQFESAQGTFEASGSIKDYQFNVDTQVGGQAIPQGSWRLNGKGSEQALETVQLEGNTLDGVVEGDLSARWQPTVSWQAALSGTTLNPGIHWPDIPGNLTFALTSQGRMEQDRVNAVANLERLTGSLRGQTLQGNGKIEVDDQNLVIPDFNVQAGEANLAIDGQVAERWNIDWQLEVPALNQLWPTASGTVSSTGNIVGSRDAPRAELDLFIQQLTLGETAIQRLEGNTTIDISGATRSQLNLDGTTLQLAGQTWQSLRVSGSGTPADHNLQASLTGDPEGFQLALTGRLDQAEKIWRGQLTELAARNTLLGSWALEQAMPLQITPETALIEQGCLTSGSAELCLQGDWNANTGASGQVELAQLDVQRFAAFLPAGNLETDTNLSGTVTGSTQPDGRVQGSVDLQLSPGDLTVTANGTPTTISLGGGNLKAESDGNDATASLALDTGAIGRLQADAQIIDLANAARLDGGLTANIQGLDIISAFVPMVQDITGQIVADLAFSGTLAAPAIGGSLTLEDGALSVPEVATRIEPIQLAVVSDGRGTLEITGSADSGPGELQLLGTLQPADGELSLNLEGKDFQVAGAKDLNALISPDLRFTINESQARLTGQLTIPEAYLSPQGGGGGVSRVSASPDVVIVSDEEDDVEQTSEENGLPLFVQVRLIFGDEVRVRAFDFQGKLEGDLAIEQTPRSALLGNGAIEVETGEYTLYGQTLQIERGRVLFNNSPLDNPNLDLRVTRTIETAAATANDGSVLVGAQVTGNARNPQLKLFSEPPMPDSSILSYLTLGTAPEAANQTAFTVGRYLTPDLYVGYGIGLFDAVSTFIMRYRLSRQLRLEATTSSEQTGADLLYTIQLK
jgi:translocation and assembly module TamB